MFFAYILVFFTALALSFVKKQPLRKIAATVAAVTGGLFILGVVSGALLLGGFFDKEPPNFSELEKRFPTQYHDLETILRMSNEDARFSRIALTFLDQSTENGGNGGRYMQDDPQAGLSKERWDQYRTIYSRNHIKLGIQRDKAHNAFIMVDSIGLLNRGHATGYLYCVPNAAADESSFEPCSLTQSSGSRKYDPQTRAEGYSFQKLADHWYAFDQGPS